jgi:hypothetical protein
MDNLKDVLHWVIIKMQCKIDRVKALLDQVLEPIGSLSPEKSLS